MNPCIHTIRLIILGILTCIILTGPAFAGKQIVLATAENAPYIGEHLPAHGYVHELVTDIFKNAGYDVVIQFYPFARAKDLAKYGEVDGFLPAYYEESLENTFVYSAPFPGNTIGLLKKKDLHVSYPFDPRENLGETLKALRGYSFGLVRGIDIGSVFEHAEITDVQYVTSDVQNIDKLAMGRIDFAVIDKYTAADLMVGTRPHLIGQLEFMQPPLAVNAFHVAFSRARENAQELARVFNQGLSEAIQDQRLDAILARHGLLPQTQAAEGKTTLTIASVNNQEMQVMKKLSSEFERLHPEIELEWTVLHENILRIRIMSDLAISDGKFDIMTIGPYETPIWGERGWIIPLEDLPARYDVDDLIASIRKALSYNGRLYALPFYAESTLTFYRKDLFQKAGIQMPQQPTYDDILTFASLIHDPANGVYGIGLRAKVGWGENMAFISMLVNTHGGQWFDMNWQPTIDTPEWRQAIDYYKDILTRYGHPDKLTNGWQDNLRLFAEGHLGMTIDGSAFAGRLSNPGFSSVSDHLGIVKTPIAKTPKGSHYLWTWALAIPATSRHQADALKFMTWATSKEYIELVGNHEGWVSVPAGTRMSTYRNKAYRAAAWYADLELESILTADPVDQTLHPVPYVGIQYVGIPEFPAIGTQVGQKISDALSGTISIEKALRDAQNIAVNQMKQSGYIQ